MTRNLKKLICVLLAVTLFCVASAIVLAEINKSTDEPSATPVDKTADSIDMPVDENAGRIDTSADAPTDAPVDVEDIEAPIDERIEAKDAPIEVKPASIMEISPFPTDAKLCFLDNVDEPARISLLCTYGMLSCIAIPAPNWFEISGNYIAGFDDMLEGLEFIPVSGDEMVTEAKNITTCINKEIESVCLSLYSEDGGGIIDVTFYRSTEDAVWAPYIRIYESAANVTTDEEFYEEVDKLKGQSWETGLYKINPETMDAQILETVTTMALGGSLDAYIDFVDEFLNGIATYHTGDGYSYYMEKFPYANIVK